MLTAAANVGPVPRVDEESLRLVLELLNRRYGFQFRDSFLEMVRTRLARRLLEAGVADLRDYYYRLLYDPDAAAEMDALFDSIANNETYFYREESQIQAFAQEVLPERRAAGGGGRVRVWSAGCSSGEEPYSLAIAALEAGPQAAAALEIFATDQSRRALERAATGVYGAFAFRSLTPALQERYFERQGDGRWRVVPEVRQCVRFGRCNLVGQAGDLPLVRFDAIFCRNVLIYFDRDARRRVVELFHDRLADGGYLFLGHSETLLELSDRFEFASLSRDLAYRR